MHHPNGTRVSYQPRCGEDQRDAGHQGTVVYHTTDNFYRVRWDDPNPNPEFFNLERVFAPGRLIRVEESS